MKCLVQYMTTRSLAGWQVRYLKAGFPSTFWHMLLLHALCFFWWMGTPHILAHHLLIEQLKKMWWCFICPQTPLMWPNLWIRVHSLHWRGTGGRSVISIFLKTLEKLSLGINFPRFLKGRGWRQWHQWGGFKVTGIYPLNRQMIVPESSVHVQPLSVCGHTGLTFIPQFVLGH